MVFALCAAGGGQVLIVEGAAHAAALVQAVELMACRHGKDPEIIGLVAASLRSGTGDQLDSDRPDTTHSDAESSDTDAWVRASDICDNWGLPLLEWFVVSGGMVSSPRDRCGEPSRWV
jgi:hypothetical protein